jgi:carbonic anhydrase/acetyltransferase-like protein (isoleucine patch superfamily)
VTTNIPELQAPRLFAYGGKTPVVAPDAFIAPGSVIVGDVEIASAAGIWFNCTLRADEETIRIGERSNLQDGTVIHVHGRKQGTYIGSGVTVGHMVLLHACTLEDGAYVGMGSTILDEAVVEGGAMLAAGALLTQGKRVPKGELWAGRPAALMRRLRPEELDQMARTVENYVARARKFRAELRPVQC